MGRRDRDPSLARGMVIRGWDMIPGADVSPLPATEYVKYCRLASMFRGSQSYPRRRSYLEEMVNYDDK